MENYTNTFSMIVIVLLITMMIIVDVGTIILARLALAKPSRYEPGPPWYLTLTVVTIVLLVGVGNVAAILISMAAVAGVL